jgi:hypothetical protein
MGKGENRCKDAHSAVMRKKQILIPKIVTMTKGRFLPLKLLN